MEFNTWWTSLPFVTKHAILGAVACAGVVSFGIVHPYSILFLPGKTFGEFQLWRLITNFFFLGKFSFNFLFELMLVNMALSNLEKLYVPSKYAEFFYMILFQMVVLLILGAILDVSYLGFSIVFAFLYIWCKREPYEKVSFFFGFIVQTAYLPWVFMGFNVLMGQSITTFLIGLASGHLYIFLKDILPVSHRYNILKTPNFFNRLIDRFFYRKDSRTRPASNIATNEDRQGAQNNEGPVFTAFRGRGIALG